MHPLFINKLSGRVTSTSLEGKTNISKIGTTTIADNTFKAIWES